MSDLTIYHNPSCSKSRQTLSLLEQQGLAPKIVKYLEQTPSAEEIKSILQKLGINARDLLRTKEAAYKEAGLNNLELSDDEIISKILEFPKLIERPIVVKGTQARIGRPPESVLEIL